MMKLLLIALALIVTTFAVTLPPGCEKAKDFANMMLTDCCPSIPKLINYTEAVKSCTECKSKPITEASCCRVNCILKNAKLLNSTGFADIEVIKEKLKEVVENNSSWAEVIDSVLNDCSETAPSKLALWQGLAKETAPTCETAINVVLNHCIIRNLFFKCPFPIETSSCNDLVEFGKECKIFPMVLRKPKPDDVKEK